MERGIRAESGADAQGGAALIGPQSVARETDDPLTARVIAAAIEVHRHLGPGLLESCYEECLSDELTRAGLQFQRQVALPVSYKGRVLDAGYRLDVVIESQVILELKAIDRLLPIHEAQIITYLRLSGMRRALLINFCVPLLKDGLRRFVL